MRLAVLSSEEMTAEQRDLYREILNGPRGQGPRAVLLSSGAGGLAGPFNAMLYAPARSASISGSVSPASRPIGSCEARSYPLSQACATTRMASSRIRGVS